MAVRSYRAKAQAPLLSFAYVCFAIVLAVIFLSIANDQAFASIAGSRAIARLAFATLIALVALVLASTSGRMRLALQITMIYFTVFLLIPGFHHAMIGAFPFYHISYPDVVTGTSAKMLIVFLFFLVLGYALDMAAGGGKGRSLGSLSRVRTRGSTAIVLTTLAAASCIMMLVFVGASVLFHTRSSLDSEVDTTTAGLLVSMPRAIIFTSFLFALSSLRFDKRKTVGIMLIIVNTPIMLIANWPPSLPRFNLFGYILMILVVLLDFRSSKRRIMITLCFVIGAMFVMPLVGGLTRENKSLSEIRVADQIDSFFNGGDFDGLQSLNNAVVYVDRYGYEHGRQALSAVLFFVPRSIWSGKADPTGSIAADAAGFKFLNISEPLPGELYVDFGFWGVGVLSLLLGVELSKLDSWIDDNWLNGPDASIVGGLVVGYATILYRGSLLGVIGPVATVVLGGIVVMRFGFKRLAPVNYVHVTAA